MEKESKLNKLIVTDDQLRTIQMALDFYSRVGIGQFGVIKDHPSFEDALYKACIPNKDPEVGDRTPQGGILEIKDGKALIDGSVKRGKWSPDHVWKKLKDVKLSTDYTRYHAIRDEVDNRLAECRNMLIQDFSTGRNGSWGIYNEEASEECRVAYDLVQVIRHEFWKRNPKRSSMTVDSSVWVRTKDSEKIKCEKEWEN
jgi:hypothetical protein